MTQTTVSAFIDLATFDEIEKYLYGYEHAITYFVRQTKKCTWFSQIPVKLTNGSGNPQFGKEFSYHVSRSGDYLLNTWLRVKLNAPVLKPRTEYNNGSGGVAGTKTVARYTNNLMHNLVKRVEIKFNDLTAQKVKSYHLDFWRCFTIPASKRHGYNKMIGNHNMNRWVSATQLSGSSTVTYDGTLGDVYLNLPLPLFYDRDSGSALPTAALPYNDMRIHFWLRDWTELIIVDKSCNGQNSTYLDSNGNVLPTAFQAATVDDFEAGKEPKLSEVELWANYAIVSQKERKRMGKHARDIVIEQVQHAPIESFAAAVGATKHYDLRFSHAVKAILFGIRNKTIANELSNYSADNPTYDSNKPGEYYSQGETDILKKVSLVYENTNRLGNMGIDYFTLVQPYYHATADGTDQPGVCMYSYSLELDSYDPMGSTNYGKLTNVTLSPTAAVEVAKSDFLCSVVNYNVIRIAGGALGFPVL